MAQCCVITGITELNCRDPPLALTRRKVAHGRYWCPTTGGISSSWPTKAVLKVLKVAAKHGMRRKVGNDRANRTGKPAGTTSRSARVMR